MKKLLEKLNLFNTVNYKEIISLEEKEQQRIKEEKEQQISQQYKKELSELYDNKFKIISKPDAERDYKLIIGFEYDGEVFSEVLETIINILEIRKPEHETWEIIYSPSTGCITRLGSKEEIKSLPQNCDTWVNPATVWVLKAKGVEIFTVPFLYRNEIFFVYL